MKMTNIYQFLTLVFFCLFLLIYTNADAQIDLTGNYNQNIDGANPYSLQVDNLNKSEMKYLTIKEKDDYNIITNFTPILISSGTGDAKNVKIAADENYVYFVWQNIVDEEIYWAKSDYAGLLIVSEVNVSNNAGNSVNPAISIDASGYSYIVWQESGNIYFNRIDPSGISTTSNVYIAGGSALRPAISTKPNGASHIAWEADGIIHKLYYNKYDTSGLSLCGSTTTLSNFDLYDTDKFPAIVFYNNDAYSIWKDANNFYYHIYFAGINSNCGVAFRDPWYTHNDATHPDICLKSGYAWLVFELNGRIYNLYGDGTACPVTNSGGNAQYPANASFGSDGQYIVWQDNRDGNWEIYYAKAYECDTLSGDIRITNDVAISQKPDIAMVGLDSFFVAWQDNRSSNYQIYLATNLPFGYGSITGTVTKDDGTTPVDDVFIQALQNEFEVANCSTNANGTYSFVGLEPGNYDISCSHPVYQDTAISEIIVTEGNTVILDIELASFPVSYGTTVITHGYRPMIFDDNDIEDKSKWLLTMAQAIGKRLNHGIVYMVTDGNVNRSSEYSYPQDYQADDSEKIIVFSWLPESDRPVEGYAEAAADAMFATLIEGALDHKWDLDQLHFIGHSRGTIVNSECIQRLGLFANNPNTLPESVSIDIDIHLTTLDSHPWDDDLFDCIAEPGSANDNHVNDGISGLEGEEISGVVVWDNIGYADNYYQSDCNVFNPLDFWLSGIESYPGLSLNNIRVGDLDERFNFGDNYQGSILSGGHSAVHTWYHCTIDHYTLTDNDGITITAPEEWYLLDDRLVEGFNGCQSILSGEINKFTVSDGISIMGDNNLDIYKIFNGDFSKHDIFGSEIDRPGWMLHGGSGEGNINHDILVLNQGDSSITHNKLFIPANAEDIVFYYKVTDSDDFGSPRNQLYVKIGSLPLNACEIILDETTDTWQSCNVHIPNSYKGTVTTIEFAIFTFGYDVDSEIEIDDVQFHLVPHCPTGGELQVVVGSPVDLLITDPQGITIEKDTIEIFAATYEVYETTPGDSGATVTIPYPNEGDYLIEVIPWPTALPEDTYSLFAVLEGDTTFFADHNLIEDIPMEGYIFSIIDTVSTGSYEYLPGDVNMANGIWPPAAIGGDVTYLVNYFKGSPSSQSCLINGFWASADANGDCIVMGSDVVRLVAYFRGAGELDNCPEYEPCWPPIPEDAPDGWPNCETLPITGRVLPSDSGK